MKNNILILILLAGLLISCREKATEQSIISDKPAYALVIHGGAGYISRNNISPDKEREYKAKLEQVLILGDSILKNGGTSLDAVEQCINMMEDSPLFNAGKGAVFTEAGENEMDASIMTGGDLKAGAVAGVKNIRNPISAARKVMEASKHVMLSGRGAEHFADSMGIILADPSYFFTEKSWKSLQNARESEKHGTVGCVALDQHGNLAAGTSTGGMTNKMPGRIGDSPVIGAGTYADNSTCAVSATGHGEYFIRNVVAYDIAARMKYLGESLNEASGFVIMDKLKSQGADGGIIAVDKDGNVAMPFNTPGMFRGSVVAGAEPEVLLYALD